MATQLFSKTFFLGIAISIFIAGCSSDDGGGGGTTPVTYSGITTNASLTATNAEEIMLSGTESTAQSVDTQETNASNPFAAVSAKDAPSTLLRLLIDAAKQVSSQNNVSDLPINAVINSTELGPEFCGGTISGPDNFGSNDMLNGTLTFNNVCYDDGGPKGQILISGTMTFAETPTSFTISYNLSVTANGLTETFKSTMTCGTDITSGCSFSSDYVGTDGKTYRVSDVSISGDDSSGYLVSATFYHPDYGKLTVTTQTALLFNCSNDNPSAGTLMFTTTDGGTGNITFDTCTSYSYSYTVAGGSPVTGTGTW